ncbi:MAG: hypothetical protein MUF28_00725 [Ignavibacterium sp.]|jgi:hypothetical protein|nr:hypothetical protein [Ignavibacterium sp.]
MKKIIKRYCFYILVLIFFVIQSCSEDIILNPEPIIPNHPKLLLVPQQYSTIQSAIDSAKVNDTILVAPGTYFESINFAGKNIVVKSSDTAENTIIDGSQPVNPNYASVVRFTIAEDSVTATLDGFTITGGSGSLVNGKKIGGGIWINNAQVVIKNCIIKNNSADNGGGIYVGYDIAHQHLNNSVISYSLIVNNSARLGSAGLSIDGYKGLTIDHCTFAYNRSSSNGPGKTRFINNKLSSSDISNTIIWEGQVDLYPEMNINYCDIKGGWSNGIGNIDEDPIFCDAQQGNFQLAYGSPCIGAGENGTNIGSLGTCGQVNNIRLVPQQYSTIQSAIDSASVNDTILVSPGIYYENICFLGKNIVVKSSGTAENTIIDGSQPIDPNYASVVRFTIAENNVTATLDGFTITGGSGHSVTGKKLGGGIWINNAQAVIINCIIKNNTATQGGGIYIGYDLAHDYLENSVFINCLIVNNTCELDWPGLNKTGYADITISHCTFAFNKYTWSSQELVPLAKSQLYNSHISSTILYDYAGIDLRPGYDINYCCLGFVWPGTGNIVADPMFCNAPLGNFHLAANSPCIGAGEDGTNIGALGPCGQEVSRFGYPLEIGNTWKYSYSYSSSHMGEWWYRRGIHFWTVADSTTLSNDRVRFSIKSVNYDSTASNYDPTVHHIIDSLIFYIDTGVDVVVVRPPSYVTGIEDNIQGYFSGSDSIKIGGRTYLEQIGLTNMLHENMTNTFYREKQQLIEFNRKRK